MIILETFELDLVDLSNPIIFIYFIDWLFYCSAHLALMELHLASVYSVDLS